MIPVSGHSTDSVGTAGIPTTVTVPVLSKRAWPARLRNITKYLGPAFIVSVAYIDPGNFATNISGGSNFNYKLIWVILWSNLTAIFLQTLSAKLGIATGMNLPVLCRRHFKRSTNRVFWAVAVVAAMATDLAEFLGAALGFYLLFKIPMLWAGLLTGVITFLLVGLERYGQRVIEYVIASLVGVISISYVFELFLAKPDWTQVALHTVVPSVSGDSITVAVGMLGATVMPHVIYLHSHLVLPRRQTEKPAKLQKYFRMERLDILLAMNIAFIINAAMVIVAAAVFHSNGLAVNSIEEAHKTLTPLLGTFSSGAFGLALLASGLSSSAVGTMAGQVIMKGFVNLEIPLAVRRVVTMLPALAIIATGWNPIDVLIISQVILSFALPAAIIPLMILTGRKEIMGCLVNARLTNYTGWLIVLLIIILNSVLLYFTITDL